MALTFGFGSFVEAIEIEKPQTQEEMEVMDVFCEQCSSSESANDEQHSENVEVLDEERSPEFSTSVIF